MYIYELSSILRERGVHTTCAMIEGLEELTATLDLGQRLSNLSHDDAIVLMVL